MLRHDATRKRGAGKKERTDIDAKRIAMQAQINARGGCRSKLAELLHNLHSNGFLNDGVVESSTEAGIRKELHKSMCTHSKTNTPYGNLVQSM